MVYRGHVENGVIRLEEKPACPEGRVGSHCYSDTARQDEEDEIPSLYERLKDFVGKAEGLPAGYVG